MVYVYAYDCRRPSLKGSNDRITTTTIHTNTNSIATWGKGNARTDWNVFAQRAVRHLAEKVPEFEGVFFVEGVEGRPWDTKHAFWWGGESLVFGLWSFVWRAGSMDGQ